MEHEQMEDMLVLDQADVLYPKTGSS